MGVGERRAGCRRGLVLALVALWACAGSQPEPAPDAAAQYEKAIRELRRGRCTEAAEKLQQFISAHPGSELLPAAQFQLGEAHLCAGDYVNAVFEYQRLIDTYPASEWVDDAQFQIAEAYFKQSRRAELDQSETRDALSHYRLYLDDYPQGERAEEARARIAACRNRLALKLVLSARLYQRQGHLEAARIYYSEVATIYPDTDSYLPALLALGDIAQAQGRPEEAARLWGEVASASADPELQREANRRLASRAQPRAD